MALRITRYWLRRKTFAQWNLLNPIIPDGDIAYASDRPSFRVGDGSQRWSDLPEVSGPPGPAGVSQYGLIIYKPKDSTLVWSTGTTLLYNDTDQDWIVASNRISVEVAPVGADIIVDIHKDGVTIFPNQSHRPRILAGQLTSGKLTAGLPVTVLPGEHLSVDVDQVGSSTPGSNLTLLMVIS